ncbi:hypothetical protein B0H17DRAFT_1193824 [Mycena rosella]|uniref:Uncharacterized protein n=1 Tax=Mycena rosella TaxID=1033263 RepID=A0AAD7GRU4_MYCRO|nr:hypothetical protein B0H17DRAFT_1193824 [Mycena rosella]
MYGSSVGAPSIAILSGDEGEAILACFPAELAPGECLVKIECTEGHLIYGPHHTHSRGLRQQCHHKYPCAATGSSSLAPAAASGILCNTPGYAASTWPRSTPARRRRRSAPLSRHRGMDRLEALCHASPSHPPFPFADPARDDIKEIKPLTGGKGVYAAIVTVTTDAGYK